MMKNFKILSSAITLVFTTVLTVFFITACSNNTSSTKNLYIYCKDHKAKAVIDGETASLYLNDNTYQLNKIRAASGEKYAGQHALLWLKGVNAIIEVNNVIYIDCKLNVSQTTR